MAINAGALTGKVVLRQPSETRVDGAKETTFADYMEVRASVENNSSIRALQTGNTALLNTDTVIFRTATGRELITDDWQVRYDGKDHQVHAIDKGQHFIKLIVKTLG